jgi:hypothetical protein
MPVVRVYPKQEQLEEVFQGFNKCLQHTEYLLANHHQSFIDRSSLRGLQNDLLENIDKLKNLYETKA